MKILKIHYYDSFGNEWGIIIEKDKDPGIIFDARMRIMKMIVNALTTWKIQFRSLILSTKIIPY